MARYKAHRDRSDASQRKTAVLAMMREQIAPPAGCTFANGEEKALWAIFTRARVPDDWRDLDLVNLFKVVQMEFAIREQTRLLESEGFVLPGARGDMVKNPRLGILRSLQTLQLQLLRALKVHAVPDSPSSMASRAREARLLDLEAQCDGNELLEGREV